MADIQGIYNRLNSGSQYTPLSAETFGDWSMEAGDLVTVVKDGRSYVTPIMQGDLKWDGASKVTIESVGNREREPLGRMSRRKYSGGGGGYWNSKKAFTKIEQNDYNIRLEAQKRETDDETLRGYIDVQAGKIEIVVDESTGKVTPASIIAAINDNKSSIKISADQIVLNGHTIAKTLEGQAIDCDSIGASQSTFGTVQADDIYLVSAPSGDHESMRDGLKTATVTGNTLKLYDWRGNEVVSFSKATSLDGAWSSTYGPFRVQATPQGTTMDIKVEFVANGPSGYPIVRPAKTGANLFVIDLDVGSITGSGVNGKRTVSAKAGDNVAESVELTDYGDGYRDGRNASTITPTAINVYTAQQGTLLSTRLSASILTAGKYISMKVGSTTYSIQIT